MDGTTVEAETALPLAGESFPAIAGTVSGIGDIFSSSRGKISSSGGELFPNESQALNDIAGLVLRSTYRSVSTLETMPNIQSDYSDLQPRQQMALSLLAAKQLLENLTLPLSATSPVVERQWLTTVGNLNIKVEYQSEGKLTKLLVQAELPVKGTLILRGSGTLAMATSSTSGYLSVELGCEQLNPTYTLEVEFPEIDQQPLLFVINPTM